MGDLTPNFSKEEFLCKCCAKEGINLYLVNALQELRHKLGVPLFVTSGYRCPHNNKDCGGHPRSWHMAGLAADVYSPDPDVDINTIANAAKTIKAFADGQVKPYLHKKVVHLGAYLENASPQ